MADIRIKDLPTTASLTSSGDFIAIDGNSNGTRKLSAATPSFLTSVTTPSLTSPAATDLTLATGSFGTALTVASLTGQVGIGTVSPGALLNVFSTLTGNTRLALFDKVSSGSTGSTYITVNNNNNSTDLEQNSGGSTFRYGTYVDTNLVNNYAASGGAFGNINFVTGNIGGPAIAMTIGGGTQKGNVGIGTTGPLNKLDVFGTALDPSLTSHNGIATIRGSGSYGIEFGEYASNAMWIQAHDVSNSNLTQTISINPLGGNVGIGTSVFSVYSNFVGIQKDQSAPTRLLVSNQTNNSSSSSELVVAAYGNSWVMGVGSSAKNSNALTWALDATAGTPSVKMTLNSSAGDLLLASTTAGSSGAGALVVQGGISAGNTGSAASYFGGVVSMTKSTSVGEGGMLFIQNTAAAAVNNVSAIRFGNSVDFNTTTSSAKIISTLTNAGSQASSLSFYTYSGTLTLALTLDETQAATFAGAVTVGGNLTVSGTGNNTVGGDLLVGSGAWPSTNFGRSESRMVIAGSAGGGVLGIGDTQAGVAANRGGTLYLFARGTNSTADIAGASLVSKRANATTGNFSSSLELGVSTSTISNPVTQLTLTETTATFAGAIACANTVNSVSPTSPNRTVTMVINGTTYYLAAKTTND